MKSLCELQDNIELYILKKSNCSIKYKDSEAFVKTHKDQIIDIQILNKEDHLVCACGLKIPLSSVLELKEL